MSRLSREISIAVYVWLNPYSSKELGKKMGQGTVAHDTYIQVQYINLSSALHRDCTGSALHRDCTGSPLHRDCTGSALHRDCTGPALYTGTVLALLYTGTVLALLYTGTVLATVVRASD